MNHPHEDSSFLPPPRKNSWILIYGILGGLIVAAFILIGLFRVSTPEKAPPKKPKVPPVKSAYALIMSPLDSVEAGNIAQSIVKEIGEDSSKTKMTVGSTTLYDQCISVAEYEQTIRRALKTSKNIDLKTQSLLFSQLVGIMISDTLPAQFYLIGRIGDDSKDSVPVRLLGTIRDLDLRNRRLGRVEVISYLTPPDDPKVQRVLSYFTDRGISISRGKF